MITIGQLIFITSNDYQSFCVGWKFSRSALLELLNIQYSIINWSHCAGHLKPWNLFVLQLEVCGFGPLPLSVTPYLWK